MKTMNVYAVWICGDKFYFSGNLSEKECDIVREVSKDLSAKATEINTVALFQELLSILNTKVKEPVFQIQIKNVFCIK